MAGRPVSLGGRAFRGRGSFGSGRQEPRWLGWGKAARIGCHPWVMWVAHRQVASMRRWIWRARRSPSGVCYPGQQVSIVLQIATQAFWAGDCPDAARLGRRTPLGPQRRLLNRCSAASGGVEKLDIVYSAQLHRRSNCRGVVTSRVIIAPASRRDIARRFAQVRWICLNMATYRETARF